MIFQALSNLNSILSFRLFSSTNLLYSSSNFFNHPPSITLSKTLSGNKYVGIMISSRSILSKIFSSLSKEFIFFNFSSFSIISFTESLASLSVIILNFIKSFRLINGIKVLIIFCFHS
ncbi:TPA: hypothetical protein DEG21_01815 [Patescibacteria group bacterium]|nr:hypothetical protein [Candidatus Gracilibacteria bacterium]HBY74624.1 hypothetical protein [Candidatus Gracilibacteria bacterium]